MDHKLETYASSRAPSLRRNELFDVRLEEDRGLRSVTHNLFYEHELVGMPS
jgi:hypothetical protein